ncbi:MAG: hypothetical protein K6G24_14580 [Lachnospiraceae bacterium]|nr:hypothetical protein [Lachnospiraceae bacterium]
MKRIIKKIPIYIGVFLISLAVMLGFLVLSAKVTKESVQENFEESAELVCENDVFFYVEEDVNPSCIDRYADSILLNIAYNFEPDNALESVMWSSFYSDPKKDENITFSETVNEGKEKNKQYLRYWHGSAGVIRILHTFLNLGQIYVVHGVILIILLGVLIFFLVRAKCIFEAVALGLAMVAVSIWYVPFSLEYTWVFICMLSFSIATVVLVRKNKEKYLGILFMLSGMVTIFLDFLTTETLTFTIPMLLILVLRKHGYKNDSAKESGKVEGFWNGIKGILKYLVPWGIGYIGMWVSKWIVASAVLGENAMPYVTEHIEERIGGSIGSVSFFEYLWLAVSRNIKELFPLDYGVGGAIIIGIIVLAIAYFCFVYKRKKVEWGYIVLLLIIGVVPIVRFMILRNHSTLHYFFVHRALAGTVFAIMLSAGHIIDFGMFRKSRRNGKK